MTRAQSEEEVVDQSRPQMKWFLLWKYGYSAGQTTVKERMIYGARRRKDEVSVWKNRAGNMRNWGNEFSETLGLRSCSYSHHPKKTI